jgi:hypothetical protein
MTTNRADACRARILSARITSEYLEMPGLSVTLAQACRLWNLDRSECTEALNSLLAVGFLRKSGGTYIRSDSGIVAA